jgi:hypothetical protein
MPENIRRTDHVRNEVSHTPEEDKNTSHKIKRCKANWIGYTLRRNYLLKHVNEGKTGGKNVRKRRGRGRKQLLDAPQNERIPKLESKRSHSVERNRFGRDYGPVI